MRKLWTVGALLACFLFTSVSHAENRLWYRTPAADWEKEALPIGNGRLGGMIFGGIDKEHIQFNEDSLWIGDEKDTGSYQAFGDIFIEFEKPATAENYRRSLDIGRAVHEVSYTQDGTAFRRTCFSSSG